MRAKLEFVVFACNFFCFRLSVCLPCRFNSMRICQAPSMVVNYRRVVRGPVASGQECSSQDHFQRSTAEQKQQIPSQGILNERRIPIE